jgi:hypothetical protein
VEDVRLVKEDSMDEISEFSEEGEAPPQAAKMTIRLKDKDTFFIGYNLLYVP